MLKPHGFQLVAKAQYFLLLCFHLVILTGCEGKKLLSEPQPMDLSNPLLVVSDESIQASLLGVVVRDGSGTWARNADWDEYLLTIANLSDSAIEINQIQLTELLGVVLEADSDRRKLVSMSRDALDRYEDSDLEITSGIGAGTVLTAGGAVVVVGTAAAVAAAPAAALGGAAAIGTGPALVAGAVLLSPVFAIAGLRRISNASKVSRVIEERSTDFPLTIQSGEEVLVDLFYPLAPSPQQLEIKYQTDDTEKGLILVTDNVLSGLHMLP